MSRKRTKAERAADLIGLFEAAIDHFWLAPPMTEGCEEWDRLFGIVAKRRKALMRALIDRTPTEEEMEMVVCCEFLDDFPEEQREMAVKRGEL